MSAMDTFESAKMLALNYIDYAPRTEAEVRRRLARAEYEEDVVDGVVADLVRAGLIDDVKFSEAWVESRTRSKKLGRVRLAAELRQKGVPRDQVDSALDGIDPASEAAAALNLARRRVSEAEIESWATPAEAAAAKRRLAGYLQRRGYNWEIIEQVFAEMFAKDD